MIIPAYLARNARKYPDHEAVIDGSLRINWAQLNEHVEQFAEHLACDHHIQPGDRVCLVIPNTYAFIVAHFAIQRLGAIVAPINVKLTADELHYIFDNAAGQLLITCALPSSQTLLAPHQPPTP